MNPGETHAGRRARRIAGSATARWIRDSVFLFLGKLFSIRMKDRTCRNWTGNLLAKDGVQQLWIELIVVYCHFARLAQHVPALRQLENLHESRVRIEEMLSDHLVILS